MGTVTVTGRDEASRLIDVTINTDADVAPPGPEQATQGEGGAQTIRLLGPFTVSWDDPDILDPGVHLVDIDGPCLVLRMPVFITEQWTAAGASYLHLKPQVGAPTWSDPDYHVVEMEVFLAMGQDPAFLNVPGVRRTPYWYTNSVGTHVAEVSAGGGALVMYADTDGALTAGEADIYALIVEPV
jgi:hypothetical protein